MSSTPHPASSLMSPTSSFSVLSSTTTRSRSSTLSYQNVDDGTASLSQSFSELSSNVAPSSQNVSDDDEDEFILIPAGSNLLNNSDNVATTPYAQVHALESDSRLATPFVAHRLPEIATHDDENDAEDEDEDGASSSDGGEEEEDEARARQRMLRTQPLDVADASDSGSEEDDVVLATSNITGRMGNLSILPEVARAPSALSVQTLTYPVVATPVPPRPAQLAPVVASAPPVVAPRAQGSILSAIAAARPPRTPAQAERRRAKKQRAKARRKERALKQQQQLSDSGSSTTTGAGGHSSSNSSEGSARRSREYDDAVAFITKYISNPPQQPSVADQLRLLQAIITELGLLSGGTKAPVMPQSIKAAKKLIKAQVHMNVKEYLTRRTKSVEINATTPGKNKQKASVQVGVGVPELKKLNYPSKGALMKSLKSGKSKIMSRQEIKKRGLGVLMVTVFH